MACLAILFASVPTNAQELDLKFLMEAEAALGISFDVFRAPFEKRMDYNGDGKPEIVLRKDGTDGNTEGLRVVDAVTGMTLLEFDPVTLERGIGSPGVLRMIGFTNIDAESDKEILLLKEGPEHTHSDKQERPVAHPDSLFFFKPDLNGVLRMVKSFPEKVGIGKKATEVNTVTGFTLVDIDGDDELDIVVEDELNGVVEVWGLKNTTTGVANEEVIAARLSSLAQNYPNPFMGRTAIQYEVAATDQVRIHVYDMLGRRIRTLVDEQQPAGTYETHWDGQDAQGDPVAAGAYFYQIQVGDFSASKQMIRVR